MNTDLPTIHLSVSGHVGWAEGVTADNIQWSIYSEFVTTFSSRCTVRVDDVRVADITVHTEHSDDAANEAQEVCSALVWSAIRAVRIKSLAATAAPPFAQELVDAMASCTKHGPPPEQPPADPIAQACAAHPDIPRWAALVRVLSAENVRKPQAEAMRMCAAAGVDPHGVPSDEITRQVGMFGEARA